MNKYNTKQKEDLLEYFIHLDGKHTTASEIIEHFKSSNNPIGKTTIYRLLEEFTNSGIINKYFIDNSSSSCYEYAGNEKHYYHLKCEKCNKIFHLECDEINKLQSHILKDHGFVLNQEKTVFYGLCEECRS